MLRARLASDHVLEAAHAWLCHRRRDYPADADVWAFRRRWPVEKSCIQADLLTGEYRFALLEHYPIMLNRSSSHRSSPPDLIRGSMATTDLGGYMDCRIKSGNDEWETVSRRHMNQLDRKVR